MRVLLSTYGALGDVKPVLGVAVLGALRAEECDAPFATGMTPTGVWR